MRKLHTLLLCLSLLYACTGCHTASVRTYAIDQSVRDTAAYRKAMYSYRVLYPCCEWCGRSNKCEVHHIQPVWLNPSLATDTNNMVTLCDKGCHLYVGHAGNYGASAVTNLKEVIKLRRIERRVYEP